MLSALVMGFLLSSGGSAYAVVQSNPIDNSSAFPDKVVSLTYDDGPDTNSLAIAQYLKNQNVAATFNVVGNWGGLDLTGYTVDGYGNHLRDVVQLGHRLGNHTYNHAILTNLDGDHVRFQLNEADRYISQYTATKFFPFTAPGSNWNQASVSAVISDPALNKLSGPYAQWYIPGVGATCNFHLPPPSTECMSPNANDTEYQAAGYTPQQFVDDLLGALDAQAHPRGNIILHDRNQADVGGVFALNATQLLVPALKQRGYVFVGLRAKVSDPTAFERFASPIWATGGSSYDGTFRAGDIDADGRVDVCARGPGGIYCSRAGLVPSTGLDDSPDVTFGAPQLWEGVEFTNANGWTDYPHAATIMLADANGDGRADIIAKNSMGLIVGLSNGSSFSTPTLWSHLSGGQYDFADSDGWVSDAGHYRTFRAADINGDGKADVCARGAGGIKCAVSNGSGFGPASYLITNEFTNALGWNDERYASTFMLADVSGDGRADVVAKGGAGLVVAKATSTGTGFMTASLWSAPVGASYDFGDAEGFWQSSESYWGTFRAGDLNSDGRADVCARAADGVKCALSAGNAFRRSSDWDDEFTNAHGWQSVPAARTLLMGDAGGDGRADLLARNSSGLIGAYAP